MSRSRSEAWEPLPADVAEWMGAADERDRPAEVAAPIVVPAQRGWRLRLREALKV